MTESLKVAWQEKIKRKRLHYPKLILEVWSSLGKKWKEERKIWAARNTIFSISWPETLWSSDTQQSWDWLFEMIYPVLIRSSSWEKTLCRTDAATHQIQDLNGTHHCFLSTMKWRRKATLGVPTPPIIFYNEWMISYSNALQFNHWWIRSSSSIPSKILEHLQNMSFDF